MVNKTGKGSISYEYLKYIKKIQIINSKEHDYAYLYLLLYLVYRTKIVLSGKGLDKFDDTFRKEYYPTPRKCYEYIYRDNLDMIDDISNINVYMILNNIDNMVINYVCDKYGNLSKEELLEIYCSDKLYNVANYGNDIPINNPYVYSKEEKDGVLKLIYK